MTNNNMIKKRKEVKPGEVFCYAFGTGIAYFMPPQHPSMPAYHNAREATPMACPLDEAMSVVVMWEP